MPRAACLAVLALALLLGSVSPHAHARPTGLDGVQVVAVEAESPVRIQLLRALERATWPELEIWSEVVAPGEVELRTGPRGAEVLEAAGFTTRVKIPNLQAHVDAAYGVGQRGDFFDSLQTYDAHVQFMEDLAAQHPDLAAMVSLGESVDGRKLWALRIGADGDGRPAVMYHGAQHGNEQAGASVVAYAANHLLENYASDPDVAALVDNVTWYLLPIMNPDGYVRFRRYNDSGVDLNRNWGGPGSGQDPSGGPFPFSEPETAALRDFFLAHPEARVHIDFHGYVRWLMWPWGHQPGLTREHPTFNVLGTTVRDIIADGGGGIYDAGTVWHVAYPVSGGSVDYSYGERGVWAFGFELRNDAVPARCIDFLPTMLYLSGWIWDCNGNGVPDAEEIADGTLADANGNDVPDVCECFGDLDFDKQIGLSDLSTLLANFGRIDDARVQDGDIDGDRDVDLEDLSILLGVFGKVCG